MKDLQSLNFFLKNFTLKRNDIKLIITSALLIFNKLNQYFDMYNPNDI